MRLFLALLGSGLAGEAIAFSAQSKPATETGVFIIHSGGRRIGTEKFAIRRAESGFEATAELQLDIPGGPRVSENCTLQLDGNLNPTRYERRQQAPKKGTLTAQFRPSETTLVSQGEAGSQEQLFYLPDHDLVVLDTNFFHQYVFLLRRFDPSRPGPQNFNVFVPQEATPAMVSLALQGKENLSLNDATLELNHFQAATEDVKIEIWATPEGEIQRISIPQGNLDIVREGEGKGKRSD